MNLPISQEPQSTSPRPFVSVVIPVYNDAARLKICLEALANQTYPQSQYEIIVIDNGSDAVEQVEAVVAQCPNAIVTQELTPGSYAARNKGIFLARGEVIAFTDADCIPQHDWLEKGVHYLYEPNCGLVAGKIEVFFKDPNRPTTIELYQSVTAFPQELYLQRFKGGATANVFTWRRVIDAVGMFDERLKSFGDLEWGKRVFLAGYEQLYGAEAQVKHPARHSWKQLYTRTTRTAGGIYDYFTQKESSFLERNKVFFRLLLEDLIPPVNFTITTFRNPSIKGIRQKTKVSLMLLLVRYVNAWEKLRLKFGGVSSRE